MRDKMLVCPSTDPVLPELENYEEAMINYAKEVASFGADFLHCDIMDGEFVSRKTFDSELLGKINSSTTIPLDVHLMIKFSKKETLKYIKAGANILTLHVENFISHGKLHKCSLAKILKWIKKNNCLVGISLKPKTDLKMLLPILNLVDVVLVMSVEPGISGQKFIPSIFERIQKLDEIRKENNLKFLIEVDGGVNDRNALEIKACGADMLVSGNYVFKSEDRKNAINLLKI